MRKRRPLRKARARTLTLGGILLSCLLLLAGAFWWRTTQADGLWRVLAVCRQTRQHAPCIVYDVRKDYALSLALNSRRIRTQNQLHIHIDCLRPEVRETLDRREKTLDGATIVFSGHAWRAYVLESLTVSPFIQVAHREEEEDVAQRGKRGILIAPLSNGAFVWLENRATGLSPGMGEELQDHRCLLSKRRSLTKTGPM